MRIIDPHVHIYKNDAAFPWARELGTPPGEDASAEMLLELMGRNGVAHSVLVQVIYYRWDNRYILDAIHRYPGKFMGVARVDPEDPDAPDHLRMWVEEKGLRGVRLSPEAGPAGDWFTGTLMDPLFESATRLKVPMLILTKPGRLPDLGCLLERHGDLDVCIDHMAGCKIGEAENIERLLEMSRYPRVFIKVSNISKISYGTYPWEDSQVLVKRVIDAFGVNRCMWGTNWPVCLSDATYAQTLTGVWDGMEFLTGGDKEWLLCKTIQRLWPFE